MGRSLRLRRGADKPGDDPGPHARQHAEGAEQGKRARAPHGLAAQPLRREARDLRAPPRDPRGGPEFLVPRCHHVTAL